VYQTKVQVDLDAPEKFTCSAKEEFVQETKQYAKLQEEVKGFLNEALNA